MMFIDVPDILFVKQFWRVLQWDTAPEAWDVGLATDQKCVTPFE